MSYNLPPTLEKEPPELDNSEEGDQAAIYKQGRGHRLPQFVGYLVHL
jgi:hypothetical protein